jgi:hypothetical protein
MNLFDFHTLYVSTLLLILLVQFKSHFSFQEFIFQYPISHQKGLKIYRWIKVPSLSKDWTRVVFISLLCSLLLLLQPDFRTVLLSVSFLLSILYFTQIAIHANVRKKANLIPITFLILLANQFYSGTELIAPDFMLKLVIAQVYFSSAIQKIKKSGLSWMDGLSFQSALWRHSFLLENKKATNYLMNSPRLCKFASICSLVFEICFPLILIFPCLEIPFALFGIMFHFGTGVLMGIHYSIYYLPVYWVFFCEFNKL